MSVFIALFFLIFFPPYAGAVEFSIPELSEGELAAQSSAVDLGGYVRIGLFGALALTAALSAFIIVRSLLRRSNAITDEDKLQARNKIIDGLIGLGVVAVSLLVIALFYPEMFRLEEAISIFK